MVNLDFDTLAAELDRRREAMLQHRLKLDAQQRALTEQIHHCDRELIAITAQRDLLAHLQEQADANTHSVPDRTHPLSDPELA
ncbi:MAG: hypothetical protein HC828_02090 [Blastochloris sp.]|nr:hypothetical protein [Blastochloris sp.]